MCACVCVLVCVCVSVSVCVLLYFGDDGCVFYIYCVMFS